MPTYIYRCPECGHTTTLSVSIATWRGLGPLRCRTPCRSMTTKGVTNEPDK